MEDKREIIFLGKLDHVKGFIQNLYHDYRHIFDIKTILICKLIAKVVKKLQMVKENLRGQNREPLVVNFGIN